MDSVFNDKAYGLLSEINTWYVFVPMLVGLIRFKKLDQQQKLILAIAVLVVLNDHLIIQLKEASLQNVWVLHLYVPILFIMIIRLYTTDNSLFISSKALKLFAIVFVGFSVLNSFLIQSVEIWPSNMILAASIFYIALSVIYFGDLLRKPNLKPLDNSPLFWFNCGLLLYNASAFLLFLFVTNILSGTDTVLNIGFSLNAIFNLVHLTSYSIALWVKPQA